MKVAFRADASLQMGSGHIMRCVTLADALKQKGAQCHFFCREHPGHLIELIRGKGHAVHVLSYEPESLIDRGGPAHAAWLGATQQQDVQACLPAMQALQPDWLIVDHYALDIRWEERLRPLCRRLMVIDDLADRSHQCDVLLDQNLGRKHEDYAVLVPNDCVVLTGPQYALLRPEFAALREVSLKRRDEPRLRNILISMGGVDPDNVTGRILASLRECPLNEECRILVVMGKNAPWLQHIKQQASGMPWQTEVFVDIHDMAKKMVESDLSIGAAGSTSWERCCLGLPSIVVVLAENQKNVAMFLAREKLALVIDLDSIECELPECLGAASPSVLNSLSVRSSQVTSGNGAENIVLQIMSQ